MLWYNKSLEFQIVNNFFLNWKNGIILQNDIQKVDICGSGVLHGGFKYCGVRRGSDYHGANHEGRRRRGGGASEERLFHLVLDPEDSHVCHLPIAKRRITV